MVFSSCWDNRYEIEGLAEGLDEGDTLLLSDNSLSAKPFDRLTIHEGKFHYKGTTDSARLLRICVMDNPNIEALFFAEPGQTAEIQLHTDGTTLVGGSDANVAWQQLTDMCNTYSREIEKLISSLYAEEISKKEMAVVKDKINHLEQQKNIWLKGFAEYNKDNAAGKFILACYLSGKPQ